MENLIIWGIIIIVVIVLLTKAALARKKPVEQRDAIDQLLVSISVMGRKNVEDLASASRTIEISKTEARQKLADAKKNLDEEYEEGKGNLLSLQKSLEQNIRTHKNLPGTHEGKARSLKKQMLEAQASGDNELAEEIKLAALDQLGFKKKALENLVTLEENEKKVKRQLSKLQVEYNRRKSQLAQLEMELNMSVVDVASANFSRDILSVNNLISDVTRQVEQQNIQVEVRNEISNGNLEAAMPSVDTSGLEDDLENL